MTTMPFGRFKGQPLDEIDDGYLLWLDGRDLREPLRTYVDRELRARNLREDPTSTSALVPAEDTGIAREVVDSGYRALARRHHPDHGGDTAEMQRVNRVVAAMRRYLDRQEGSHAR